LHDFSLLKISKIKLICLFFVYLSAIGKNYTHHSGIVKDVINQTK